MTIREQREAAKAMTQYFRDLAAAKNAEKAKYVWPGPVPTDCIFGGSVCELLQL